MKMNSCHNICYYCFLAIFVSFGFFFFFDVAVLVFDSF